MKRFMTADGGDVFFAGTYNGHPVSMAAAIATIEELETGKSYEQLYKLGNMMKEKLSTAIGEVGVKAQVAQFGSVFHLPHKCSHKQLQRSGSQQ